MSPAYSKVRPDVSRRRKHPAAAKLSISGMMSTTCRKRIFQFASISTGTGIDLRRVSAGCYMVVDHLHKLIGLGAPLALMSCDNP